MDREILFRGKRIDNGEWVDGCYMTDEQDSTTAYIGHIFGVDAGIFIHDMDVVGVVPETVCQYAGLTDKNGKKIFEGDIVDVFDDILKIVWDEIFASFCIVRTDSQNREFYKHFFGEGCEEEDCEVIGNIFDNPELLEGGTE